MTTYVILRFDPIQGGSTVKVHALDTVLTLLSALHGAQVRTGRFTSVVTLPATGELDIASLISDVFGKHPYIGPSSDADVMARAEEQYDALIASSGTMEKARDRANGKLLEYVLKDMYLQYDTMED